MRKNLTAHWTEDDTCRLRQFVESGTSPLRAAAALGRSMTSVKNRARLLGTPFPNERKVRKISKEKYVAAASEAGSGPVKQWPRY